MAVVNPTIYHYVAFFNSNLENLSGNVLISNSALNVSNLTVPSEYQNGVSVGSEIQFNVNISNVDTTFSITVPETTESTLQLTLFSTGAKDATSGEVVSIVSVTVINELVVEDELTRIENAKESIATAITNKGVTVPSGTKLDEMAALIDSISGGGSGGKNTVTIRFTNNSGSVVSSYLNPNGEFTEITTNGNYEALGGIFYVNEGVIVSGDVKNIFRFYLTRSSYAIPYVMYCAFTDGTSVIFSATGGGSN